MIDAIAAPKAYWSMRGPIKTNRDNVVEYPREVPEQAGEDAA